MRLFRNGSLPEPRNHRSLHHCVKIPPPLAVHFDTKMGIIILPATAGDATEMVRVGMKAFANDLLNQKMFNLGSASPEEIEEYRQWRTGLARLRMSGPGKHFQSCRRDFGRN